MHILCLLSIILHAKYRLELAVDLLENPSLLSDPDANIAK